MQIAFGKGCPSMAQKKQASGISRLMQFAGTKKYLVFLSCVLSAISTVLSLCPFIWLWFVAREIFTALPDLSQVSISALMQYAWLAVAFAAGGFLLYYICLLYTSPSPRDRTRSRMPSSA